MSQAIGLLPTERDNNYSEAALSNAIVGGPLQAILRPVEIESRELIDAIHKDAMFGEAAFFDRTKGVTTTIQGSALVLVQERGAGVQVDEQGSILVRVPAASSSTDRRGHGGLSVLIEKQIHAAIGTALTFGGSLLEHIDPTQRLTHVGVAARIDGAEHLSWRTRAEHDASPTRFRWRWAMARNDRRFP